MSGRTELRQVCDDLRNTIVTTAGADDAASGHAGGDDSMALDSGGPAVLATLLGSATQSVATSRDAASSSAGAPSHGTGEGCGAASAGGTAVAGAAGHDPSCADGRLTGRAAASGALRVAGAAAAAENGGAACRRVQADRRGRSGAGARPF